MCIHAATLLMFKGSNNLITGHSLKFNTQPYILEFATLKNAHGTYFLMIFRAYYYITIFSQPACAILNTLPTSRGQRVALKDSANRAFILVTINAVEEVRTHVSLSVMRTHTPPDSSHYCTYDSWCLLSPSRFGCRCNAIIAISFSCY